MDAPALIYVSGEQKPDFERLKDLRLSDFKCTMSRTERGPDGKSGWLLSGGLEREVYDRPNQEWHFIGRRYWIELGRNRPGAVVSTAGRTYPDHTDENGDVLF
jgi:hypothetical protein